MCVILTVLGGPHQGQVFTFVGQESFVVGRAKKALFRLPKKDKYISRNHFVVEVNPPYCRLIDLQSRNGTFVNDEPVHQIDLHHDDIIRIGRSLLQVRLDNAPEVDAGGLPTEEVAALAHLEPLPDHVPAAPTPIPLLNPTPFEPSTERVGSLLPPPRLPPNLPTDQDVELPPLEDLFVEAVSTPSPVLSTRVETGATATPLEPLEELPSEKSQPVCPLCGQPWQTVPGPGQDRPRAWCDICAKAMKLLHQQCPGYLLVRELGRGTTGTVYQAVREVDQTVVAVRHLSPEEAMGPKRRLQFGREIQLLRSLRHPGIVSLLDNVEAEGQIYLVLELVKGETAAKALARTGPFEVRRAAILLCQCLEALECAHAMQVLHREIKPTSILLELRGGTEQARLMDFSLEWICQIAHVSRYSLLKGQTATVTWMPPEQVYNSRELQPGSDLYALAATFYTLLTGRTLFVGEDTIERVLRRVLEDEPTPLRLLRPEIPLPLADVLHRALAKEPENRFATAREFRRAVELFGKA